MWAVRLSWFSRVFVRTTRWLSDLKAEIRKEICQGSTCQQHLVPWDHNVSHKRDTSHWTESLSLEPCSWQWCFQSSFRLCSIPLVPPCGFCSLYLLFKDNTCAYWLRPLGFWRIASAPVIKASFSAWHFRRWLWRENLHKLCAEKPLFFCPCNSSLKAGSLSDMLPYEGTASSLSLITASQCVHSTSVGGRCAGMT